MYKSTKILVALAAAGIVATAGTAFTASSTIDDGAINVGSVTQSVSGATITSVVHEYNYDGDMTTQIEARAEELLSTADDVVKVTIGSGSVPDYTTSSCTVSVTDVNTDGVDDGATDFSSITCAINESDVRSVRFVVNG